jgi:hypothetical protein
MDKVSTSRMQIYTYDTISSIESIQPTADAEIYNNVCGSGSRSSKFLGVPRSAGMNTQHVVE